MKPTSAFLRGYNNVTLIVFKGYQKMTFKMVLLSLIVFGVILNTLAEVSFPSTLKTKYFRTSPIVTDGSFKEDIVAGQNVKGEEIDVKGLRHSRIEKNAVNQMCELELSEVRIQINGLTREKTNLEIKNKVFQEQMQDMQRQIESLEDKVDNLRLSSNMRRSYHQERVH